MMLRNALVTSILVHSAILLPLSGESLSGRLTRHKDVITVEYIRMAEPEIEVSERPKIDIARQVKTQAMPASMPSAETFAKKQTDFAKGLAIKQAKIRATREYGSYYQLIREKIRRKMFSKYRSYHNEGNVCLVFVLNSEGALLSANAIPALSTRDRSLINIAIQSLSEAAPFSPFPKTFTLPQLSFTVTISFKKR